MWRQLKNRLQPRLQGPSTIGSLGRVSRKPLTLKRSMATVAIEGIPKEPTELDSITKLPNGLRVASEALPGSFSGVGVYVEAGSRYENDSLRGVSHIMDRLAFKSTSQKSADDMLETVEALGGNIQCASSRESMMYQAATFNQSVPTATELLAETIRHPRITEEEVAAQIETARYEIAEIWGKPELILPELVHTAAYKDNTLGNPLLCPEERLGSIDRNTVLRYRDLLYRPDRIVLAFAWIEHAEAVRLAERYFGDMETLKEARAVITPTGSETSASEVSDSAASTTSPTPSPLPSPQQSGESFFHSASSSASSIAGLSESISSYIRQPAHYTGGFLSLPPQPPALNKTNLTHIFLCFEGLAVGSDDIYALAALQTLLGGGGSFSAGGPGKGMYSRLFTQVLNQHGFVESCVSFNHSYTDSGLFGISASCMPGHTSAMLDIMCQQFHSLTLETGHTRLQIDEVERAKNQLRSGLLMNLESRMVELEDLGRSVQVHDRKVPVREMCQRIEALQVEDLRRVARDILGGAVNNPGKGTGAPTVVLQEAQAYGLTSHTMSWDKIQDRIDKWRLGRRD